jgi:hypothetical protein
MGFTEIFKLFTTYYKIDGYPEYTAVCTTEYELRIPLVEAFIFFYLK